MIWGVAVHLRSEGFFLMVLFIYPVSITILTLNIQTPQLFAVLVLKFEHVHFNTCWSLPLWTNSADAKLIFFVFCPPKIGFDISCKFSPKIKKIGFDISCKLSPRRQFACKLSPRRQFAWNIKAYFLGKNKIIFRYSMLNVLPTMRSTENCWMSGK